MQTDLKNLLSHVFWIGGAPDAGKSSVARRLSDRFQLPVLHYDKEDARHTEVLAQSAPEFRRFLDATLEERWVQTTPGQLFDFLLLSFRCRFDLVIQDLLKKPVETPVIVEGFGLLPELLQPHLSSPFQAIWFVPSPAFKRESMMRRGKPSFADKVSKPEVARENVFRRDTLLAEYYRFQTANMGLTLIGVDGSRSEEEMTETTRLHFSNCQGLPGRPNPFTNPLL